MKNKKRIAVRTFRPYLVKQDQSNSKLIIPYSNQKINIFNKKFKKDNNCNNLNLKTET